MYFPSLIILAASLLLVSAEEEGKLNRPCPRRCSQEEATKAVLALQAQLEERTRQCDFLGVTELTLPSATFASVDQACVNGGCCSDVGSLDEWWSYYACYDSLFYPTQPNSIEYLKNGTIVISKPELDQTFDGDWNKLLYAYKLRYHWYPVASLEKNCDFRLGFIDGYSYNCPAYIPGAISCDAALCTGV